MCSHQQQPPNAAAQLKPLQVGIGVKGSCEAVAHSLRFTVTDNSIILEECWSRLADFYNGFNMGDRGQFLEEVRVHFSQFYLCAVTSYGQYLYMNFSDIRLNSEAGVQQGDPWVPIPCLAATASPRPAQGN